MMDHLSSSTDVPVAGDDTTCPVAGSICVSGIGSFSGWPLISVPKGVGSAAVADDVDCNGSLIWKSVSLLPATTTSPKEKTFDLNLAVIFWPWPAFGRKFTISGLVRLVSSQDAGPC